MHEISLVQSLLEIAEQELLAHGASRLRLVRVRYGALDRVEPEAMRMGFEALTLGTPHEGARLELVEDPLLLRCQSCQHLFTPPGNALFLPCPSCGDLGACRVESGEGIFLDHLEAE